MAHHPRDDIVAQLPHLRAFARSLVGGDRAHLADDLVQDTVVLALRGWEQFTPGTDLKAWLFRILHNRCHSVRRRKHFTSEIHVEDLERRATVPAAQESRLELVAFKAAFAELNPAHREVLVLVAVQGLPYEQVAAICGCELGTVKSRANRARALLKKRLLGDGASGDAPTRPGAARQPHRQPRGPRLRGGHPHPVVTPPGSRRRPGQPVSASPGADGAFDAAGPRDPSGEP